MTFIEIADKIFNNSNQVIFGTNDNWQIDVFKANWFTYLDKPRPNAPGLYWFLTDSNITKIERPTSLPNKGCDFEITTKNNLQIFPNYLLSELNVNGLKVVYNGHENNVMNRVRQHFNLSNNNTGALGIKHYKLLSNKNWVLKYFTTKDIGALGLDNSAQDVILNLLNSKTGRSALENAWRIKNGWPILCKK
ncbi:hypothetical protein CAP47_07070 [Psychroflexus sp. S27]|uniref:hypothetical protein n=1 Tax=Psychroflexus sp. S27 TaxID=1982757 RepID=UPI000C29E7C5|nr:hypothetical protein [Psychroflexus sp. S27]PJX22780.1 hypothetical protein CAP47_07070 [Psychroflexus sp. S27]